MSIITLSYNVDPIINNTTDQIAYLIRHFIYNPGFTSSLFGDKELSLRGMVGKYTKAPSMAANAIADKLQAAINRVLPDVAVQVEATFIFPDETSSQYTLKLSIMDSLGNLILPINMITVKDQTVTVKYEGI